MLIHYMDKLRMTKFNINSLKISYKTRHKCELSYFEKLYKNSYISYPFMQNKLPQILIV
jgi:hypothetical protein